MGKLQLKYKNLCKALNRLEEVVIDFEKFNTDLTDTYDARLYRTFCDSMIQRFELCVAIQKIDYL